MCIICLTVFSCRGVVFYSRAANGRVPFLAGDNFYNDNLAFLILELIPSFLILLLMRQSKNKPAINNNIESRQNSTSGSSLRRNYSGGSGNNQNQSKTSLLSKSTTNGSGYGAV